MMMNTQVFLRLLLKHKKLMLVVTVGCTLLALAISFVLPPKYRSEASLLPKDSDTGLSALFGGMSGQMGAALPLGMLGGGKRADIKEVAASRTVLDRVIERLHLEEKFPRLKSREEVRQRIRKMVKVIPPTLKNNVMIIRAEAKDPQLAANMANAYVAELKSVLNEIGFSDATKTRRFIETQLKRAKDELTLSEQDLAVFQAESKLVSLPETVQSSIKALSDLEASRIQSSLDLSVTQTTLSQIQKNVASLQGDPQAIISLQVKQQGLRSQQKAIESAQQKLLTQINGLPPKAMKLARLQRDVQVKNAIYLALTQQFETAVISEAKDADAFIPLDAAIPAEKPDSPKKAINTVLGLILGFLLSVWLVLLKEMREARPEERVALADEVSTKP